jgi:hypothetical protein
MFLGPAEEHKRPICESRLFFRSSPLSPLFCAPLPPPHSPATPAPHSPCVGYPGSAPALPRPGPALPRPCAGRPTRPCPTVHTGRPAPPRVPAPSRHASLHRRPVVRAPPPPHAYPDPALPRNVHWLSAPPASAAPHPAVRTGRRPRPSRALPSSMRRPPSPAPPGSALPHPTWPIALAAHRRQRLLL